MQQLNYNRCKSNKQQWDKIGIPQTSVVDRNLFGKKATLLPRTYFADTGKSGNEKTLYMRQWKLSLRRSWYSNSLLGQARRVIKRPKTTKN